MTMLLIKTVNVSYIWSRGKFIFDLPEGKVVKCYFWENGYSLYIPQDSWHCLSLEKLFLAAWHPYRNRHWFVQWSKYQKVFFRKQNKGNDTRIQFPFGLVVEDSERNIHSYQIKSISIIIICTISKSLRKLTIFGYQLHKFFRFYCVKSLHGIFP